MRRGSRIGALMRNQLLSRVPYPLRLQVMPSESRISSAKTRFQESAPRSARRTAAVTVRT